MNITSDPWLICGLLALFCTAAASIAVRERRRRTADRRKALASEQIRQRRPAQAGIASHLAEEETVPGVLWTAANP